MAKPRKRIKARKNYPCSGCTDRIQPGTLYTKVSWFRGNMYTNGRDAGGEGDFDTGLRRYCEGCSERREYVPDTAVRTDR